MKMSNDALSSMSGPLRIAVVGHTNTGKTSLLRTLTRDRGFGQVSFRPATTRHVEVARLLLEGRAVLALYDTPGIEDPMGLREQLEDLERSEGSRLDGPARIQRFLETDAAADRFEQEAKVLTQLLQSDAALYVIDARDPVLAKHRDELLVLNSCGVPLLPLLNFVADPGADEEAWRDALGRAGLHAVVRFDTVAPARGGERLLYEKLATLLDPYRELLQALISSHEESARQRHRAALAELAAMLIDVAALRRSVSPRSPAMDDLLRGLNDEVREREQQCVDTLLALYGFSREDIADSGLPLVEGQWRDDLFDPRTLQRMGIRMGGGAAAGAAAGMGVDVVSGGLTLGGAAAIGALAGGGWQTLRHYGGRLRERMRGEHSMRVDDAILRLLAARQLRLIELLEGRGHAAVIPVAPDTAGGESLWRRGLPAPLRQARDNPQWSPLNTGFDDATARHEAIEALTGKLLKLSGWH